MPLTLAEAKDRIVNVCTDLGAGLPYNEESIDAVTWEELADELAVLARHAAIGANRIAAYAGVTRRRANKE